MVLVAGGDDPSEALSGLQRITIIAAVPIVLVMVMMCVALTKDLYRDPIPLRERLTEPVVERSVRVAVDRHQGETFGIITLPDDAAAEPASARPGEYARVRTTTPAQRPRRARTPRGGDGSGAVHGVVRSCTTSVARIMAMTTTSLADAKNRLSELVASAESTHERTVVTKNGRPAAVLMSVDDLESLEETLALLSDREALVDIAESEITARHGLFYTSDETWDGTHACSDEESERRLVARMGRAGYDAARAAVRADLLASSDAAVRERAAEYV